MMQRLFIYLVFGVAILAIYFGNVQYQSYLGRKAMDQAGLTSLPLDQAVVEARKESKQVLVNVAAIWGLQSTIIDQYVFADPEVQDLFKEKFIYTRLEYDSPEGQAFLQARQATGFPNLWILDSKGKVVKHLNVVLKPGQFIEEVEGE